jgi:S1-C subfamily serine protease
MGLVIKEESWAKEISLGPLTLTDVPIMEADSSEIALMKSFPDTRYEATFGLAALKRLDIIIDGKRGVAYLRFKKTPSLPYEHNRLGAAFVPRDPKNDDLVAHVVDGSPAYEAGIRNDDVLLKIGELDATKWRTDPKVLPLSRFWNSPAGTKLELTLKRGDKVFKTTAVLRNILPPDAPKNSN